LINYHLNNDIDISSRRGEFIDLPVAWIGSHFNVGAGTRIADFGCGPGLYANRLARLGASITGIDFSERSIEHARTVAAQAGFTPHEFYGNVAGAPFAESASEFAIVAKWT